MRLSIEEQNSIIRVFEAYIGHAKAELRLYGSRIKDDAKGGDIDLMLLVENHKNYNTIVSQKIDIILDLKEVLGDQKIDLLIDLQSELDVKPFLKIIYPQSKILKIW